MGSLSPWHWLIVILVFVLLFGSKRLPDAARSLGKSMRIFKSEVKELQGEAKSDTKSDTKAETPQISQAQAPVVAPVQPAADPTDARPA
ncbi:MAG: Sec-independent protein translocase subunit TatA [Mycobacterium sp.]|nr:Sec-independent protein translocase subunit TatA [Mycobacterium sp.]